MSSKYDLKPLEAKDLTFACKSLVAKVMENRFQVKRINDSRLNKENMNGLLHLRPEDQELGLEGSLMLLASKVFQLEHRADYYSTDKLSAEAEKLARSLNSWCFKYLTRNQISQIKDSIRQRRRLGSELDHRIRARLLEDEKKNTTA